MEKLSKPIQRFKDKKDCELWLEFPLIYLRNLEMRKNEPVQRRVA